MSQILADNSINLVWGTVQTMITYKINYKVLVLNISM